MTVTFKRGRELAVGDALLFLGRSHRITELRPYVGPLADVVDRVAHVEGHGAFMSVSSTGYYRVAA